MGEIVSPLFMLLVDSQSNPGFLQRDSGTLGKSPSYTHEKLLLSRKQGAICQYDNFFYFTDERMEIQRVQMASPTFHGF